jgi:ABC-type iron transport system FetAB permease component
LKSPRENRDKVEIYLAFGATRVEACRPVAIQALKLALMPTINNMRQAFVRILS